MVCLAELERKLRVQINESAFYEIKIWRVPKSKFFSEGLKYSLAIIKNGKRVVGYDNERAKGHHKHVGDKEVPYAYLGIEALLDDFKKEVEKFRGERK